VHRLTLAAAFALGACTAPPPTTVALRNTGQPIYSAAAFDPSRLDGTWHQVASIGPAGSACRAGAAQFAGGGTRIAARLCLGGAERAFSGQVTPAGPGRLAIDDTVWWVLWVDSGYRTMAIGTPSGAFGFLLDRAPTIPPDRLEAARTIMSFNGYDPTRLRPR